MTSGPRPHRQRAGCEAVEIGSWAFTTLFQCGQLPIMSLALAHTASLQPVLSLRLLSLLHCSSLLCWPLQPCFKLVCCVVTPLCVWPLFCSPLLCSSLPPLFLTACCAMCGSISFPLCTAVSSVRLCCQCVAIPGVLAAMLGSCVVSVACAALLCYQCVPARAFGANKCCGTRSWTLPH